MGLHLYGEETRIKRDLEHSYNTMTGWCFDTFTIIATCNQTFNFLETCFKYVLPKIKMTKAINMQSTGVRQQFTWTNKMVDDLIGSVDNFKVLILSLMEFKDRYLDGEREAQ